MFHIKCRFSDRPCSLIVQPLFAVLTVISLIGMSELYKVVDAHKKALGITGYVGAVCYYALLYSDHMEWMTAFTILFLVVVMAVYVFTFPAFRTEQVMVTFFGLFYVAVMLSYIYQTRILEGGIFTVWLVFVCSWAFPSQRCSRPHDRGS